MRILASIASIVLLNSALFAQNELAPSPTNNGTAPVASPPRSPGAAVKSTYTPPDLQPPVLYTYPGFVFQRNGEWVGSDYLYNLQNDIGLSLDILS